MSDSKQVQFSDLPVIDNIALTDKVMIDTADGIRIIAFQDLKKALTTDEDEGRTDNSDVLKLDKPLVNGSPSDGNPGQYLRSLGNGNTEWADTENTENNLNIDPDTIEEIRTALGTVSKSSTGLVPALPNETTTTKFLRQDGTWTAPPDNNTTYTAGNGLSLSGTEFRNAGVTGIKGATDSDFRTGNITLTKDTVGLAAVENKSSATIREEITRENVIQALGYDPAGVLRYKGIQATLADIQALTGSVGGDVWFCTGDNNQYAYNGSTWDSLGTIDLSGTITYIQNWVRDYVSNTIESD